LEDIQNIEDNISVLISQSGLQQYFTTVKNYYTVHYAPFIVLFETPENSSAEAGEMAHKIQVKKHHEASNHKNPEKFMVNREHVRANMQTLDLKKSKRVKLDTKENYLSGFKKKTSFNQIIANWPFEKIALDPFKRLILSKLPERTDNLFDSTKVEPCSSLYVNVNGLLFRGIATKTFHNRERFDSVGILGQNELKNEIWYAQLLMLFRYYEGSSYAFVRWYETCGCPRDFPLIKLKLLDRFDILKISAIVEIIPVAPSFRSDDIFFINDYISEFWKRREVRKITGNNDDESSSSGDDDDDDDDGDKDEAKGLNMNFISTKKPSSKLPKSLS